MKKINEVIYRVVITKNGEIIFSSIINHLFDYTNLKEVVSNCVHDNSVYTFKVFTRLNKP